MPIEDDEDPPLSITEVARRLDCSRRTVHRRIDEGALKSIVLNPGGLRIHRRVRTSELERFLEDS